jgi:hypothetical protein
MPIFAENELSTSYPHLPESYPQFAPKLWITPKSYPQTQRAKWAFSKSYPHIVDNFLRFLWQSEFLLIEMINIEISFFMNIR